MSHFIVSAFFSMHIKLFQASRSLEIFEFRRKIWKWVEDAQLLLTFMSLRDHLVGKKVTKECFEVFKNFINLIFIKIKPNEPTEAVCGFSPLPWVGHHLQHHSLMSDHKSLTNDKDHHPDLLLLRVCHPPSARTLARVSRSLLPRCPDPPGQPHPFRSMGVNLSLPRSSPPGLWPPLARAPQQGCLPLRHHQERHLYTVIVVSEGNCNSYRDQTYCLLLLLQSQDNDSPWHHRHCFHQGLLKLHSHCWLCHRRRQVVRY